MKCLFYYFCQVTEDSYKSCTGFAKTSPEAGPATWMAPAVVSNFLADYPAMSVDRAGGGNPLYAGDTPIQEFLIWCAPIQEFLNRCAPIQEFLIW